MYTADRYTKGVLTVIAVCLAWLCLVDVLNILGHPAFAAAKQQQKLAPQIQRVVIVGFELPENQPLPVKIASIEQYKRYSSSDPGAFLVSKASWEAIPTCSGNCGH